MDEKEFDYLNVIPLVDVMLVLLTIVLTTSTFIVAGGLPVELPRASGKAEQEMHAQTIQIDKSGLVTWNARAITLDTLPERLRSLDRRTPIVIRADRALALQSFVDVLDVVKSSDFTRVSLQTEERR